MSKQADWRFCQKCHGMFFDGIDPKGSCPATGPHEAAGFHFTLPFDQPEDEHHQSAWRFCDKCHTLFFDGFLDDKGLCPRDGGPHLASGLIFVLPHDIAPSPTDQGAWRFCGKDKVLFFDGLPHKGVCDAGGEHEAAGFEFVLPHVDDVQAFDTGLITVPGGLPLSGSAQLTVTRAGDWTLRTHAHDAGFDNIDYSLVAVLLTPSGAPFTFTREGHLGGTFSSDDRSEDAVATGSNPAFAGDHFDGLLNSSFAGRMNGSNVLLGEIRDAAVKAAEDALGKAAAAAATSLLG